MKEKSNLKHNVYYTYSPSPCGLTDNLERFDVCHRIGLSLGYEYVHTPLNIPRSSNEIDDFLGFSNYFTLKIDDLFLENHEVIKIDLFSLYKDMVFSSIVDLQSYIKEFVSSSSVSIKNKTLIIFSISKRIRVGRKPMIIKTLQDWLDFLKPPHQLDYRSIYFQARKKSPRKSRFTQGKVRMLVHIRQGDTAVIKTPWKTFIPLAKLRKQINVREYKNRRDIDDRSIDVEDFYNFLREFLPYFDKSSFSLIVSSDGYKRGFMKIIKQQRMFNFSDKQISKLKELEKSYDKLAFSQFNRLDDCFCLVGETDENLNDLIQSTLTADIILVGTQQRMIPKLLEFYSDADNPQIMLVLHKLNHLPNLPKIDTNTTKIIKVNIDELNFENIAAELHRLLSKKTNQAI